MQTLDALAHRPAATSPEPLVDLLAELCRAAPTRAKWVFVPSHAMGRVLGERLTLHGTNWLNVRFVTPLDVALRMGAPFLVERGIDPSEEGLGPALAMRLMLDLPRGYFGDLVGQPTMAQALWSTVRELRMCDVRAAQLRSSSAGDLHGIVGDGILSLEPSAAGRKRRDLADLLAAYERFLADAGRADLADVYAEALRQPGWCPIQPHDCWTEAPDVAWTPLQRRLLDAMPGERIPSAALALPGAGLPRRLRDAHVARLAADPECHPLAFLMTPGLAKGAEPTRRIHLFHAGGRDAEVEEVIRRILQSRTPLDQVEIACASDEHVALVWEKALRHEWRITLGPGIPAAATRPGRALLGLCDWVETDFSAAHLRHLLQSGDMGLEADDEGFTAGQAARILARAETGWGRAAYDLSLHRLWRDYEARAAHDELGEDDREAARDRAALTQAIRSWVTALVASIPEPSNDGLVPLQEVVEAALQYLDRSTARSSALDHRAAASLAGHIADLRALGAFRCPLDQALRFVRERVLSLQVAPDRPRPGHLFASTLSQAAHSGRPHLFIVGLEEGRVFPAATEDPVLLDDERNVISPALRLATDRVDEAVYGVLGRLAAWGGARVGSVTFSYSTRDTREFRETYASWLMLQAYRLQQGDAALSYPQMKAALGEPVSCLPAARDEAASGAGWWLRSVHSSGPPGRAVVESEYPNLLFGRTAEEARASHQFTAFDGFVPEAGPVLDPCATGHPVSVTDLEGAASCAFRFLLKRGLGLRSVDERERDRDVWLDPLVRGTELHDVYASLLRRCRDAGRQPDVEKDGAWLRGVAQARLTALHHEMPAATTEILERETREFLADVELFLDAESEPSHSEAVALEVSFGYPLNGSAEPLADAEPVEIDLGEGLRFRIGGRIDRINRVGADRFEIVDYKTGGYWPDKWKGTFDRGRRLQHALYGLAAAELLRRRYPKARVTGGVYVFPTHKGERHRVPIAAPPLATTAAVLADLRALILAGGFVHATDEGSCRFCEYKVACGRGVHEQAERKAGDPALAALGRLSAHE